jgi:hypothetical protein
MSGLMNKVDGAMVNKVEVESKLQLSRESFEALLKRGQVKKVVEQLNVYYDHDWLLAQNNATFRVRLAIGSMPSVTLKLAKSHRGHERVALEVERPPEMAFPLRPHWRAVSRCINVEKDLSLEYRNELLGLNLSFLSRVGWMRNRRHIVEFKPVGTLEADLVWLPNGEQFFEVEIETDDDSERARLVEFVCSVAPTCTPSLVSKFERFRRALSAQPVAARN